MKNARIADMHDDELVEWADGAGLTLEELARIQPSYDGPWFIREYEACAKTCIVCDRPAKKGYEWDGKKLVPRTNAIGLMRSPGFRGWQVDSYGRPRHADGSGYRSFDFGHPPRRLSTAFDAGSNDAWFAGNGVLAHLENDTLTEYDVRGQEVFTLIGTGPSDVWILRAGFAGALHWDGSRLHELLVGEVQFQDIVITRENHVFLFARSHGCVRLKKDAACLARCAQACKRNGVEDPVGIGLVNSSEIQIHNEPRAVTGVPEALTPVRVTFRIPAQLPPAPTSAASTPPPQPSVAPAPIPIASVDLSLVIDDNLILLPSFRQPRVVFLAALASIVALVAVITFRRKL